MKSTKILASLLLASAVGFGAEAKKKNYITKDITWGFGVETGYDTNIYNNPEEEESFVIRVSPYISYEHEFGIGPLKIDYRPEYSWYDNKWSSLNNTWNHNLDSSFKWELAPTVTWEFLDSFSEVEGNNISTVGGVTTGGFDNDYTRNVFETKLVWEFIQGQNLSIGYMNDYVHYKTENNDYRDMKANEVIFGYENAVTETVKLGAKLVVGASNFFNSDRMVGTTLTTRDTEWMRYLATANIKFSQFILDMTGGLEHRRVADDVAVGVDRQNDNPYADIKLIYLPSQLSTVVLHYVHRTVAGNIQNSYWATQDRVAFEFNHEFTERIILKGYYSWENNDYQQENTRQMVYDDENEVWTRSGLKLTYKYLQDLDFVVGFSYDRLCEPLPGDDKYNVIKYDLGMVYEF
jgi:hypothetical protein